MEGERDFPPRPAGRCSEHRIEVDAPAKQVWGIASDIAGWGRWNPLYTQGRGNAREGETIRMTVAVPGLPVQQASATVATVRPDALLEYGMSNAGGLLRAFRYIEIRPLTHGRCIVLNGEILSGLLGPIIAGILGGRVHQGLQAMNEALKARAEMQGQKWPEEVECGLGA